MTLLSTFLGTDLPTALTRLTAALLTATAVWAALVAALASWRPTARLALRLTPRILRAVVFTGVSGAFAMGPTAAAMVEDLDGLPLPDRPTTTSHAIPVFGADHTVQPGESLWSIAASALPSASDATATAEATARWYAINRRVIGADPDLIKPGQVLIPPSTGASR